MLVLNRSMLISKAVFLLIVPIAIAATAAGFFAGSSYEVQQQRALLNKALPLPLDILINPLISQWRGDFEGRVVEKTGSTLTIEKDRARITVKISAVTGPTRIYDFTGAEPKRISFGDIPLNAFVRGEIFLPPKVGSTAGGEPGEIVARSIGIYPEP